MGRRIKKRSLQQNHSIGWIVDRVQIAKFDGHLLDGVHVQENDHRKWNLTLKRENGWQYNIDDPN